MATKVISGVVDGIRSLADRSLKLSFTTQEISPSDVGDLFSFQGKYCKMLITDSKVIQPETLKAVEDTEVEAWITSKSPSMRLRAVLFRLWEKDHSGDFDTFYKATMERIIEHYKDKLDAN